MWILVLWKCLCGAFIFYPQNGAISTVSREREKLCVLVNVCVRVCLTERVCINEWLCECVHLYEVVNLTAGMCMHWCVWLKACEWLEVCACHPMNRGQRTSVMRWFSFHQNTGYGTPFVRFVQQVLSPDEPSHHPKAIISNCNIILEA